MSKKLLAVMMIVSVIFTASLILVILQMKAPDKRIAEVLQDGIVLYTIDLNSAEDQTIRIDAGTGSYNVITIENGEIYVSDAGCPDHTCMKTGILKSENVPIVCLPNKLVIRFQ